MIKNVVIRAARFDDIDALLELENISFSTDNLLRRNFYYFIKNESTNVIVATVDKKIIGCVVVLFRKNSLKARIYSLAVHPDFRRMSISYQLIDYIEKSAITRKKTFMLLEVRPDNLPAIHFYKKHGYQHFGEYKNFYEDGADALRMIKPLK